MIKAIFISVFKPDKLSENRKGLELIIRYGWIFIIIRWFYYSLIFQFRDYHGRWMPFASPPFNLDLDAYAYLQKIISLPFGLVLMLSLAMAISIFMGIVHKRISLIVLLNILGITFFLPFIIVQPIDQLIIYFRSWNLIPVTIIHTSILLWESWASVEVISILVDLKKLEKRAGIVALCALWMFITGFFWR